MPYLALLIFSIFTSGALAGSGHVLLSAILLAATFAVAAIVR